MELGPGSLGSAAPLTLPEREEDHGLDGEELEDGLEGPQELPGGEVEKEQGIESQADGGVVDEGDIQVAAVDAGIRASARVREGRTPPEPSLPLSAVLAVTQPTAARGRGDPIAVRPHGHGVFGCTWDKAAILWVCVPWPRPGTVLRRVACPCLLSPASLSRAPGGAHPSLPALLEVPIVVFANCLQDDGDQGHDRLHDTELQSGLGVGEGSEGRGRRRGSTLGSESRQGGQGGREPLLPACRSAGTRWSRPCP